MNRLRRTAAGVLGVAAWWVVSCRDIPAPTGGVMALSPVRLPLPGLVVGDTMRDSTGLVAPLQIIAYGVDGEPILPQPAATFIALDTTAHVTGALLIGDRTGTARVVGAVSGLQSQIATVKVTESPDLIVAADSVLHRKGYVITDTVAVSPELTVIVQHAGQQPTGVEAVIVRYSIDRQPPGVAGKGPTVVLTNGSALSSRDTTDASGRASRTARLRLLAMDVFQADTVQVSATASHHGASLGTVTFTIIFTKQ